VTLTGAPFRSVEADAEGVSRKRLRSPDVTQPFRGVNVAGRATLDYIDRVEALLPLLRAGDAFSHITAARLLGAQLPSHRQRETRVHVTTIGGGNRVRRPGVAGYRAQALPVTLCRGLPVVEPAHTWVQLATMLSHDDLVAVGDRWVTAQGRGRDRQPALTSIGALRTAIPDRGRGAARARRALADVRVGAESRMETLLRLMLVRSGLPEPLVNPTVRIDDQNLHPDLLYPGWGVVLEYEGDGHRTDPRQWRRDISRREAFEAAGYRVVRVHRDDVLAEPEALLARVCRIIAQRRGAERSGTLVQAPTAGRLSE